MAVTSYSTKVMRCMQGYESELTPVTLPDALKLGCHAVYYLRIFFVTGSCTTDPTVIKVQVNGTWKLPVQSAHVIQNVIVSHENENGTFLSGFTLNSDEKPHYIGNHFKNRVKPTRSQHGKTVDFLISDATAADGGMYSVRVTSLHNTHTSCYKLFVVGK